ncbi:MAG TPA: helix-turn-helix transcriptional regulator [Ktedonobacterales bacterium]|nr:helix-turn-helix transcriptional regulator [Ktedonobacterales bacterium]
MELGEKLRRLRMEEGLRRGLWRAMTQREVTRALRQELGVSLSQAYLSRLESGARLHLSNETREALARFYRIRPGELASDPSDRAPVTPDTGAPDAQRLLERLAGSVAQAPEPERALRLVERLLALPPETLAVVETALETALGAPTESQSTAQTAQSDLTATSTRLRS